MRSRWAWAMVVAGAALGLAAPGAGAQAWTEPAGGNSLNQTGDHGLPPTGRLNISGVDVATVAGVPYVAWGEWNGSNYQVRTARLVGDTWQPAGVLNRDLSASAFEPSFTVADGVLWITWAEGRRVHVARLTTGGWQVVGTPIDPRPTVTDESMKDARFPHIAIFEGRPYVALIGDGVEFTFHVVRLAANNSDWEFVGGATLESIAQPPTNDITVAGGRLYAAHGAGFSYGRVLRLNEARTAWEELPLLSPDSSSYIPKAATSVGGALGLLWRERNGSDVRSRVSAPTSSGWQGVGLPGPFFEEPGDIAEVGGTAYVIGYENVPGDETTRERQLIRVERLGGATWEAVGGALNRHPDPPSDGWPPGSANVVNATIAGAAGTPYAAWAEWDGANYEVRVARFGQLGDDDAPGGQPPGSSQQAQGTAPAQDGPAPGSCGMPIEGGPGADTLVGGSGPEAISGFGGPDRLLGAGGDDCIFGGGGNDLISGGAGDDQLRAQRGADRVRGGAGDDYLHGASGSDRLYGGPGGDGIDGNAGHDLIVLGRGRDAIDADAGNDRVEAAGGGVDLVNCGAGRDVARIGPEDLAKRCERVLVVQAR